MASHTVRVENGGGSSRWVSMREAREMLRRGEARKLSEKPLALKTRSIGDPSLARWGRMSANFCAHGRLGFWMMGARMPKAVRKEGADEHA